MCSTSVEPSPSMMSRPDSAFQALNTSAEQDLGRRHRTAAGSSDRRPGFGRLGQRGVERRQAEEHGGPVARDASKIAAGLGWPGSSTLEAPDGEREGDGVAEAVGEEDLRHREADVVRGQLQQMAGVGRGACRPCRAGDARCPWGGRSSPTSTSRTPCRRGGCRPARDREPAWRAIRRRSAASYGAPRSATPLTTTRVSSRVSLQAVALKRSAKAASQMAMRAPESAR